MSTSKIFLVVGIHLKTRYYCIYPCK